MEMCKEEKAKFFTVTAPQLCAEASPKQRASEHIDPLHTIQETNWRTSSHPHPLALPH